MTFEHFLNIFTWLKLETNHFSGSINFQVEHAGDHATFLCIDVTIENKKFIYKLYDKRDDCPFNCKNAIHE